MDVFGEASRSPEGFIKVDFLTGTCAVGTPSPYLARAIALYKDAFADLCRRHGTSISAFRELTACYSVDVYDRRFVVAVEDQQGHRATDEYVGTSGRRVKVLDHLGRVRRKWARGLGFRKGDDIHLYMSLIDEQRAASPLLLIKNKGAPALVPVE